MIEGSNMAECHPVAFRWVMQAKLKGAKIIHVDPRFTRTSALADLHVPLRAGTDIAFLGGIIHHVLSNDLYFRDYVVAYTNAPVVLREDFRDTEDLGGVFSGLDADTRSYDNSSWQYEGTEVQAASGERDQEYDRRTGGGSSVSEAARGEAHGSGGAALGGANPSGTRRSATRGASSRCSSGTTPATRPSWSSGSAGCRRTCSVRCASW
jgi:formate dehydrogenase major subunit